MKHKDWQIRSLLYVLHLCSPCKVHTENKLSILTAAGTLYHHNANINYIHTLYKKQTTGNKCVSPEHENHYTLHLSSVFLRTKPCDILIQWSNFHLLHNPNSSSPYIQFISNWYTHRLRNTIQSEEFQTRQLYENAKLQEFRL